MRSSSSSYYTTARKKLTNPNNVHVLSLPNVKQQLPQHRGFLAGTTHRNSTTTTVTTTTAIGAKPKPLQSHQTQQLQTQQQQPPPPRNNNSYLVLQQRSPTFILALGAMVDHLTRCDCTFQQVAPMYNDPTNDTLKVAYRHHTSSSSRKKKQPSPSQKGHHPQPQHCRKQ